MFTAVFQRGTNANVGIAVESTFKMERFKIWLM